MIANPRIEDHARRLVGKPDSWSIGEHDSMTWVEDHGNRADSHGWTIRIEKQENGAKIAHVALYRRDREDAHWTLCHITDYETLNATYRSRHNVGGPHDLVHLDGEIPTDHDVMPIHLDVLCAFGFTPIRT